MKAIFLIISCFLCFKSFTENGRTAVPQNLGNIDRKSNLISINDTLDLINLINSADENLSVKQLADIITISVEHGENSLEISKALVEWLKENHPIYAGKSPIDVSQLRGYLMYHLGQLPPTEILYSYIKNDLIFAEHTLNLAAAAYTAKLFPSRAEELIDLMTPIILGSSKGEWVDITTYKLNFPIVNPTKAKYEAIKTLEAFEITVLPEYGMLVEVIEKEQEKIFSMDSIFNNLAKLLDTIGSPKPNCCTVKTSDKKESYGLIPQKSRRKIDAAGLALLDQDGNKKSFKRLTGKPFVLTFFYTNCTNPLKCASTVDKMGKLQKKMEEKKLEKKTGIYGMTYDASFDSPSILKSYGQIYGLSFSNQVKFFVPQEQSERHLFEQLNLKVNYGYGNVNQHGMQLFLFDKKGRIAYTFDNDLWNVNEVYELLTRLVIE